MMVVHWVANALIAASLMSPVAASTPASAMQAQPAATPVANETAAKAAAVEEKKICKQLPSSSSRLPNRACLTADQWKKVVSEEL